jgi:hypothetical protein
VFPYQPQHDIASAVGGFSMDLRDKKKVNSRAPKVSKRGKQKLKTKQQQVHAECMCMHHETTAS